MISTRYSDIGSWKCVFSRRQIEVNYSAQEVNVLPVVDSHKPAAIKQSYVCTGHRYVWCITTQDNTAIKPLSAAHVLVSE